MALKCDHYFSKDDLIDFDFSNHIYVLLLKASYQQKLFKMKKILGEICWNIERRETWGVERSDFLKITQIQRARARIRISLNLSLVLSPVWPFLHTRCPQHRWQRHINLAEVRPNFKGKGTDLQRALGSIKLQNPWPR